MGFVVLLLHYSWRYGSSVPYLQRKVSLLEILMFFVSSVSGVYRDPNLCTVVRNIILPLVTENNVQYLRVSASRSGSAVRVLDSSTCNNVPRRRQRWQQRRRLPPPQCRRKKSFRVHCRVSACPCSNPARHFPRGACAYNV